MEALKKERQEIRRQKYSSGLYNRYENNAGKSWERGQNNNPGANRNHREGSRSRSRSKEKQPRENDNASNYSFILGRELSVVNKALGGMQLKENSVVQSEWSVHIPENEQNANRSVNESVNASVHLNAQQNTSNQGREGYNWNGAEADLSFKKESNWSYSRYMNETEKEEERKRVECIVIDDD